MNINTHFIDVKTFYSIIYVFNSFVSLKNVLQLMAYNIGYRAQCDVNLVYSEGVLLFH